MDVAFGASFLNACIAPALAIGFMARDAQPCFIIIIALEAARYTISMSIATTPVRGLPVSGTVRFGRHGSLSGAVVASKELCAFGEPQDKSGL